MTAPLDGHYARKQLRSRLRILSWSHGSRFQRGQELVAPFAGQSLLDYGCGDGTFLAMVREQFPRAVGADVDPGQLDDCRKRFAEVPGIEFVHTRDLADRRHDAVYGLVVCMEVLEHCPDAMLEQVLDDLRRLVSDDGHVVISVPIETGPGLLVKQGVRQMAAWRGIPDYRHPETYSWGELFTMVFAGERTAIPRPAYGTGMSGGGPDACHGHKGFNWRDLRRRLRLRFHIERLDFSPLRPLGPTLNSQVWFVCRPRTESVR